MIKRYFTPNIRSWKYIHDDAPRLSKFKKKKSVVGLSNDNLESIIDNSTDMMDFAISFTKTVVRISFILFVIVNVFIMTITAMSFFTTKELMYMDTLITESYGMLRDVIAAYIIKAGTENALRIGFSVLSDYIDKKYDIKIDNTNTDNFDDPEYYDDGGIDEPFNDEDPSGEDLPIEEDNSGEDGGIDIIK